MGRLFARGTHAKAVCDRCGFVYPYLETSTERGTLLRVCHECNDGAYNRVDHPQNKPPRNVSDAIAIKDPRPERIEPSVSSGTP